ncbi:MAG: heparinase II/III family protein [Bacteroidota bacterium]|nr:heparinase II/III family protein [Bacteroidota bacterium]
MNGICSTHGQSGFAMPLWRQLLFIGLLIPAQALAQHPRYDTYTGFATDTTPVLPAVEKHPSLYFSADFIPELRLRKADQSSRYYFLWQRFRADALRYITKDMSLMDENDRPRAAKTLAFWWIIEEDSTALQKAIEALLVAYNGVPQTGEKPYDEIYRAIWLQNYAAAYDWVYDHLTSDQNTEIRLRIVEETQYLRDNIMVGDRLAPRPHNHRSKPAWAIGTAALVLSDHDQAADWLSHALEAANTVTRYQFSADGIYREGGHYWMYNAVNFIPFLWHYLNVSGVDLFGDYQPAFEWPIRVRTGRGQIPNIEDSYLKPAPTHMVAAAYKGVPTSLNADADFAAICQWNYENTRLIEHNYTGATVDVAWEIDEYILFDSSIESVAPTVSPNQFLEGGQVVFRRSWEPSSDDRYLLFHGVADADNHNHPDQLSFFLGGNDAILAPDAGYGPDGFSDDRRGSWYLKAHAHNILTADGFPPVADDLYSNPSVLNVTPFARYEIDSEFFGFAEKESGYVRPNDVSLRRSIAFIDQDYFVVSDLLYGSEEHTYRSYLHGRGSFNQAGHYLSWSPFGNRYGAAARLDAFILPESASLTVSTGYISLFKDERHEQYVEAAQVGQEAAFMQLLLPARSGSSVPDLDDLSGESYVAARLVRSDSLDYFFLQARSELRELGEFATDATFAWLRNTDAGWQNLALREANQFESAEIEVSSDSKVTLALDASTSGVLDIATPAVHPAAQIEVVMTGAELVQEVRINGQPSPFTFQSDRLLIGLEKTSIDLIPDNSTPEQLQAYPNPFSHSVTLEASVNRTGPLTAEVYNLLGQRIRKLEAEHIVGTKTIRFTWDGYTESGSSAPSAIYFVRLTDARGATLLGRVVRVR